MTCALLLGTLTLLLPATSFAQDEGAPAALKVHPEAARLNAEALIAEGKYRDAGRYLQKYLNGNPTDEEAWLLQASVFEHIKRYDLAERALSRAGEVRGVYLARARIAYRQDKFPEALAAVRKALELLRAEGLVDSRQGFGWFVAGSPVRQTLAHLGTIEGPIIGAVIYALGRPNLVPRIFGYHELFHVFVFAAATCHFVAIWGLLVG